MKRLALGSIALTLAGCSHRVAAHRPIPEPAVKTAVHHQVRNAVALGEGDLETQELRRKLLADPKNLSLRLKLAEHYAVLGFPELAIEHYRLASEAFPENTDVLARLMRSLANAGLEDEAMATLDRFLALNPEAPSKLWAWKGILEDNRGRYAEGETAHRKAIAQSEPKAWLLNNLGENLLLQGKDKDAAAQFLAALNLEPRNEMIRNNLAVAMVDNPAEAVVHLQSVTDPATAHSNMAAILMERGRYKEARQELNLALGYSRNNMAALKNLALLSELEGQPAVLESKKSRRTKSKPELGKLLH